MKPGYLYIFLLVIISLSHSQFVPEWVQLHTSGNINIDLPQLSAINTAGDVYAANSFYSAGNSDVIVTKFNNTGMLIWQRIFNSQGTENQDYPKKLLIDQTGKIIIVGNASSGNYLNGKIFILKYDETGSLLNSAEYKRAGSPISQVQDAQLDITGNIFLTGNVIDYGTSEDSVLAAKFNSSLTNQWAYSIIDTSNYYNFGQTVLTESLGNVYVSAISGSCLFNMKYSGSGTLIWRKSFYAPSGSYPANRINSAILDNTQNLYAVGDKNQISGNDTAITVLVKYNSAGTLQWSNSYNIFSYGAEKTKRILTDGNNLYLHVTSMDSVGLAKVNFSGQLMWVRKMGSDIHNMNLDQNSNIVTTGYKSAYQQTNLRMEKWDSQGNLLVTYFYNYNGSGVDQAMTFFNTSDSKIILGAYHNSSLMFLKLTPSVSQSFTLFRNNLSKAILDSQYTYDTISISTMQLPVNSQIKEVSVNIDTVLHTGIGDLNVLLQHESRTDTLILYRGATFDNFIGTKLRDTSESDICTSGLPPYTGYFSPCFPLVQFNNLKAHGPWILKIYDRRSPNTGILKAWSLSVTYEIPIAISIISSEIPTEFRLKQNYPNPFNPVTKIRFSLPKASLTKVIIYDILGKEIRTLVDNSLAPGTYESELNASELSSGIYFYRLITEYYSETRKMILLK